MEPSLVKFDVAVRGGWCDRKEEWLCYSNSIIKEAICLAGQDIRRVFSFVANRWLAVSLEASIQVFICVRVEKEIGAGEARGIWRVVICQCVRVEELASIVGIISGIL